MSQARVSSYCYPGSLAMEAHRAMSPCESIKWPGSPLEDNTSTKRQATAFPQDQFHAASSSATAAPESTVSRHDRRSSSTDLVPEDVSDEALMLAMTSPKSLSPSTDDSMLSPGDDNAEYINEGLLALISRNKRDVIEVCDKILDGCVPDLSQYDKACAAVVVAYMAAKLNGSTEDAIEEVRVLTKEVTSLSRQNIELREIIRPGLSKIDFDYGPATDAEQIKSSEGKKQGKIIQKLKYELHGLKQDVRDVLDGESSEEQLRLLALLKPKLNKISKSTEPKATKLANTAATLPRVSSVSNVISGPSTISAAPSRAKRSTHLPTKITYQADVIGLTVDKSVKPAIDSQHQCMSNQLTEHKLPMRAADLRIIAVDALKNSYPDLFNNIGNSSIGVPFIVAQLPGDGQPFLAVPNSTSYVSYIDQMAELSNDRADGSSTSPSYGRIITYMSTRRVQDITRPFVEQLHGVSFGERRQSTNPVIDNLGESDMFGQGKRSGEGESLVIADKDDGQSAMGGTSTDQAVSSTTNFPQPALEQSSSDKNVMAVQTLLN